MGITVNKDEFEPYQGEPDIERLIRAMRREEVDRVPNWEALIEDQLVEKILGRFAGNTLAYGGDPAKGVIGEVMPMKAKDYIEICNIIGHDVMIIGTSLWPPFRKEDEDGRFVEVADKSIKNLSDFKKLKRPTQKDIDKIVAEVNVNKDFPCIVVGVVVASDAEDVFNKMEEREKAEEAKKKKKSEKEKKPEKS